MKHEGFSPGYNMDSFLGKRDRPSDSQEAGYTRAQGSLTTGAEQPVMPSENIMSSFLQEHASEPANNCASTGLPAPLVPPPPYAGSESNANWQDTSCSSVEPFESSTDTNPSTMPDPDSKAEGGTKVSTAARSSQKSQRTTRRKKQQQRQSTGKGRSEGKKETSGQLQKRLSHEELERIAAGEGPNARKAARQLRNRMSAAESRRKKEQEIEDLKKTATELESKLAQKDKELEERDQLIHQLRASLKASCGSYTQQNRWQQVQSGGGTQGLSMSSANPAVVPVVHSETDCSRALLALSQDRASPGVARDRWFQHYPSGFATGGGMSQSLQEFSDDWQSIIRNPIDGQTIGTSEAISDVNSGAWDGDFTSTSFVDIDNDVSASSLSFPLDHSFQTSTSFTRFTDMGELETTHKEVAPFNREHPIDDFLRE